MGAPAWVTRASIPAAESGKAHSVKRQTARKRRLGAIMGVLPRSNCLVLLIVAGIALPVNGSDNLVWSGFAFSRHTDSPDGGALDADDGLSGQLDLGLDWTPSPSLGAHLHMLARTENDGSERGSIGVAQAYLEFNAPRGEDRLKILGGAFFLPTSRENIDALWENPYAISSSALNTWLGEEFRPIGIDAAYTIRRTWTVG